MKTQMIAAEVRDLRLFNGISQTELARRAGVGVNTVLNYENNKRDTTVANLLKMLSALGMELLVVPKD